jgi:hypothetical protein
MALHLRLRLLHWWQLWEECYVYGCGDLLWVSHDSMTSLRQIGPANVSRPTGALARRVALRVLVGGAILCGLYGGAAAQITSPFPPPASAPCVGDCDGSHDVTVNELIIMVNIALGTAPVSTCTAGDADSSGDITVNEIVAAVNNALNGCSATPTPAITPLTPTRTPTQTLTVTPSPTNIPTKTPGCEICTLFGVGSCPSSAAAP